MNNPTSENIKRIYHYMIGKWGKLFTGENILIQNIDKINEAMRRKASGSRKDVKVKLEQFDLRNKIKSIKDA